MEQINEKTAMAMLRCCAWLWEHCSRNPNEGEFRLSEVLQGMGRNAWKSKPGNMIIDTDLCKHWDVFHKYLSDTEGLSADKRNVFEITFEHGTFKCHFLLDSYLYDLTARYCRMNAPNILRTVRFCYKEGERWTVLPQTCVTQKKQKAQRKKNISSISVKQREMTIEERLRAALLAHLAA